jgi:hypothetical protein
MVKKNVGLGSDVGNDLMIVGNENPSGFRGAAWRFRLDSWMVDFEGLMYINQAFVMVGCDWGKRNELFSASRTFAGVGGRGFCLGYGHVKCGCWELM